MVIQTGETVIFKKNTGAMVVVLRRAYTVMASLSNNTMDIQMFCFSVTEASELSAVYKSILPFRQVVPQKRVMCASEQPRYLWYVPKHRQAETVAC